ncbi:MAG: glycosyltransferase family 4 protein [Candidatus Omnitrophica bacterium]|nr:glycosyltransferase family 4 protein [Candidatus Omnitrophota bacterium]
MRILMVTDSFYPDGAGGKHTYVYYVARELVRQGHRVCVLTLRLDAAHPPRETIEGIEVVRYTAPSQGRFLFIVRPIREFIAVWRAAGRLLRAGHFDIINAHTVLPALPVLMRTRKKQPGVFTFHASMYQEVVVQSRRKTYAGIFNNLLFRMVRRVEAATLRLADFYVVLSAFNEQQLRELYGIAGSRVARIAGGVDIERFCPADRHALRTSMRLPADKTILLTVRRLVARMGLENLIDAMQNLTVREPHLLLLIIGDGFLRNVLEEKIKRAGLQEQVRLLGRVGDERLARYYQSADIFVLPTEALEGFGLVTLEALACGVPVLGTPVGGTVEILSGLDKDFLFAGADAPAMAEGIRRFLRRRTEWESWRSRSRSYAVAHYSYAAISRELSAYFSKVSGGAAPAA